MSIRRSRWAFTAAAALVCAGAMTACNQQKASDPTAKTIVVRASPLEKSFEEPALFEAAREVSVYSPVAGKVLFLVESGSIVKQGEMIGAIDVEATIKSLETEIQSLEQFKKDYEKSVETLGMDIRSAALDVDTAMGELDYQRLRLEDTNRELARLQLLRDSQIVPEEDVRDARSKSTSAALDAQVRDGGFSQQKTTAAISETKTVSGIGRTLLEAQRSQDNVDRKTKELAGARLSAPATGYFQRKADYNWQRRARVEVQAGEEVYRDSIIGSVAEATTPILRTQIAESQYQRVREGMPVEVSIDSLGGKKATGKVVRVGTVAVERESTPAGSLTTNTSFSGERVFEVVVHMDGEVEDLRPGLSGRARFITTSIGPKPSIPLASVWTRSDEHIVAIRQGSRWSARKVKLGESNLSDVQVSEGLNEGDTILATDPRAVLNDASVGS